MENTHVWLLGLLHSGTTIFWKAWRNDQRFLCYDEPFSDLHDLPHDNWKSTYAEFIQLFNENPRIFWEHYAPMEPLQEFDSDFTLDQMEYLQFLLQQSSRIVIDETHLHLHLPALANVTPQAYVIHLYRRASCFATSHLRPTSAKSGGTLRRTVRWIRDHYNRLTFWQRHDYLPGMRRDEAIGSHSQSKFGLLLAKAGYDVDRIMTGPVLVRLLAYWHYHYHFMEERGPQTFGDRFISVRYEDFANDPEATMQGLYRRLGLSPPANMSFPDVHAPKPAFQPRNRAWREAANSAGFSDREIETLL